MGLLGTDDVSFWITVPNGRWKPQFLLRNKNFEEFGVWVKLMLNSLKFKGKKAIFTLTTTYVWNLSNISVNPLLPKDENTAESCLIILDLTGFGMIILKSSSYYEISYESFGGTDSPVLIFPAAELRRGYRDSRSL